MPLRGTELITTLGESKLIAAAGNATSVAITEVAIGDGNGQRYAPAASQTALRRELARQPIESRAFIGSNSWRTKVVFDSATPAIDVREIGFFDATGDLIFLWAGTDVEVRQTGAIDYVLDHVLNFSQIAEGVVVVNAPDDEVFALQQDVATLQTDVLTRSGASFWVDQANGDDSAAGTEADPLETIAEACARMVPGGQHVINLMSNYYWQTRDTTRASDIIIRSNPGGPQHLITFADSASNVPDHSPGLSQQLGGLQMMLNNLGIRLSDLTAAAAAGEPAILLCTTYNRVKLLSCDLTLLAGANQSLVAAAVPQDLFLEDVTFAAAMAGRWVEGVAAGTAPASLPNLRTNLSSL